MVSGSLVVSLVSCMVMMVLGWFIEVEKLWKVVNSSVVGSVRVLVCV